MNHVVVPRPHRLSPGHQPGKRDPVPRTSTPPVPWPLRMLLVLASLLAACVKAPSTVYLVDQKTVLEQQASGELRGLARALEAVGLQPGPQPFTPAQLDAAGVTGGGLAEVADLYAAMHADADQIDALLRRRCLGEALSGLLELTPDTCSGTVDPEAIARLVQRENRNRRQVWAYIAQESPGVDEAEVRAAWRRNHLLRVVCGGQIQAQDGSWVVKTCSSAGDETQPAGGPSP